MNKKLTYEEVKYYIEVESDSGCKLISKEYISNSKKLLIQCKCGNIFNPKFSFFKDAKKRQRSCNECRKSEVLEKQRFKYEDIKHYIEVESKSDCKLISKEYLNVDSKLDIMCKCGNIFELSFYAFRKNKTKMCDECKIRNGNFSKAFDYEYVKNYIEVESGSGCKLISDEYLNNVADLELECKCGNKFETTFNTFKGRLKFQCNDCSNKNSSEKQLSDYNYVKNYIEENSDCKLLSQIYKGVFKPLTFMCSCGEIFECSLSVFNNKKYKECARCLSKHLSETQAFNIDEVKKYIEIDSKSGCVLLSNSYNNAYSILKIKCLCGNIFHTSYGRFKYKNIQSCDICRSKNIKYKGEIAVRDFLIKNNLKFFAQKSFCGLYGVKKGLLSYDFYLPSYNLLIEYQGEFHDGTARNQTEVQYKTQQEHDKRKRNFALNNNINLLEIWYYDFDNIEEILTKELIENKQIKKIT